MPNYQFRSGDGETIEKWYPADDAPDLGAVIVVGGKRYTRILSSGIQIDAGVEQKVHGYPYVSNVLPKELEGVECVRTGKNAGKPIIRSQNHEREVGAMCGMKRD